MKVKSVKASVYTWQGPTATPRANLSTNPMDALGGLSDTMGSFRFHQWLIVEVETTDGIVGLGNCALAPPLAKQIIDQYLAPLVIGRDPLDVEALFQTMYRSTMAWGRKGVGMAAISAIDIALWDINGKAMGVPVFKLLGGRTKKQIPVYASRLYSQPLDTLAAEAQGYLDEGFTMMKLRLGWGPQQGPAGMAKNVDLVRTVRETVGPDIDIMIECYMGWTLEYARRMIPRLLEFSPRWLEEPVLPDDIAGYAYLNQHSGVPISGGEHEFTLLGFKQLLDAGALSVIQYDTNRVGGITVAQKINALAEAYQVPVVPHAGQMHNYHLTMANLNCPISEYFPVSEVEVGNELFYYLFEGDPQPRNGFIDLDDTVPGLGVSLNKAHLHNFSVAV
ncbi:L-rhamnose 1-epimerase [Devosia psychrophila]|uniref:L-rhamnose 1-epimerase n=1 Tax=Devosia psychrophila TaxID=728005 RepID=A0ABR5E261_9HYPH|nr:L-rhamnonate dehydratase [Devosia psychrophila]KKC34383.1 L-rhamnose 1-epimerase [Devosia psychrophila]